MQRLERKVTKANPLVLEKRALGRNLEILGRERNAEVEIMHYKLSRIEVMRRKNTLVMGISVRNIRQTSEQDSGVM